MVKYLIGLPLLLVTSLLQAQSIETKELRWSVLKFYDKESNETTSNASVFETGPQRIRWIQKNGARVYDFEVKEVKGNWKDSTSDGELLYSISFRGHTGTIAFSRKGENTTIETNIPVEGKNILPYIFSVNSISPL